MHARTLLLTAIFTLAASAVQAQSGDPDVCRNDPDAEAAIEACSRVINSGSYSRVDLGKAYLDRGQKLYTLKRYDDAISNATSAIQLNALGPVDLAIAYSNRGNAYFATDRVDQAIGEYTTAIRINPKYAAPYTARGLLRERKGEIDSALADFRRALSTPLDGFSDDDWARGTAERAIERLTKR
jgi:tetratricopeptide (TPR) repeat protein